MIVSDIEPLDKKRNKIFVDKEFAFVLYKGELHLHHIEIGKEIDASTLDKIEETLQKRAKMRAMNLLMKKDYTEKQICKKLQDGYYDEKIIEETVEYLKSYGYIDDERYVRSYFAIHISVKPKRFIVQKLMEKGIQKELIDKLTEEIYEEESKLCTVPDEEEIARKLLKKRNYQVERSMKEMQKAYAYLLRKGINSEIAMKLVKELQKETELLDII